MLFVSSLVVYNTHTVRTPKNMYAVNTWFSVSITCNTPCLFYYHYFFSFHVRRDKSNTNDACEIATKLVCVNNVVYTHCRIVNYFRQLALYVMLLQFDNFVNQNLIYTYICINSYIYKHCDTSGIPRAFNYYSGIFNFWTTAR